MSYPKILDELGGYFMPENVYFKRKEFLMLLKPIPNSHPHVSEIVKFISLRDKDLNLYSALELVGIKMKK